MLVLFVKMSQKTCEATTKKNATAVRISRTS